MKVVRKIHPLWQSFQKIAKTKIFGLHAHRIFGKWQYFYSSKKGKISLIELPNYLMDGKTLWEIFCIKGSLFPDIDRFNSKEEAEERILHLLG